MQLLQNHHWLPALLYTPLKYFCPVPSPACHIWRKSSPCVSCQGAEHLPGICTKQTLLLWFGAFSPTVDWAATSCLGTCIGSVSDENLSTANIYIYITLLFQVCLISMGHAHSAKLKESHPSPLPHNFQFRAALESRNLLENGVTVFNTISVQSQ